MSLPGNASYSRLETIDYKTAVDQAVGMFESLYRYSLLLAALQ